jgi:hypothetical protein
MAKKEKKPKKDAEVLTKREVKLEENEEKEDIILRKAESKIMK